jgi:DNA-directed RNA polymerase subunit RPC12/RpoP
MEMSDQKENADQSTGLEIVCRNCKAKFVVPEQAIAHKEFPCPACSFFNQAQPPGKLSRANILAKFGKVVGDEPEVDEQSAYRARMTGGIALFAAILLAIIYTLLNN